MKRAFHVEQPVQQEVLSQAQAGVGPGPNEQSAAGSGAAAPGTEASDRYQEAPPSLPLRVHPYLPEKAPEPLGLSSAQVRLRRLQSLADQAKGSAATRTAAEEAYAEEGRTITKPADPLKLRRLPPPLLLP